MLFLDSHGSSTEKKNAFFICLEIQQTKDELSRKF